ncbi:right-handed parallel beta-helix repeat-containing protein [Telluribacter sp.]|jgi:parallel beta-helix repeat protein|uniref:right-handed parallel beta-helix repeat-containing protein n=1 Tax=Telluribacter sp. TaxID=1978767 RepID=UPI002E15B1A0|nr:right-handed parallel beta-helix repeat-containing protein [Telluribacter sp.]
MRGFNTIFFGLVLVSVLLAKTASAQKFIHPGISQSSADLAYMKQQVLKGEQPWQGAFELLKAATDLHFIVKPHTHVIRGSYGRPNIGGDDLSKSANMAYNCALMWYITDDKAYAKKAIEILNAWAPVIRDFDFNDAKLLAAWTGHIFCNAAEILRYTDAGWQQKDIDGFSHMLMTVYYPLMRNYYPQANGNWDGAIIHSLMAIAIFTDNRPLFNNALDHFLRGPVNGSLFKYIYPSGQCQETTRDQAHVQLGLGEFAGAAQIAYTQGVDLFSIGNNRLALGYEYTAGFLMGEKPHSYGTISERAKTIRDDYEYVYRHYTARGLEMPYTRMAADSARPKATRSVLTAFRAPDGKVVQKQGVPRPGTIASRVGAMEAPTAKAPATSIFVTPEQSLQEALNKAAGTGGWVVAKAGLHTLPATLKIPSGVTLAGEGISTVLFLDPKSGERDAMVNAEPDMHDVIIRDLVVEGSNRPVPPSDPNSNRSFRNPGNRGGLRFLSLKEGQMKNISFINLTVQNCTVNGVFISGASGVKVVSCNFDENGSSMVPGPKLQHNLLLTHCEKVTVQDSRLDTSPFGSGIALSHCRDVTIQENEIARNAYYGILISESKQVAVQGNLIEGNDHSGVMIEYLSLGSEEITVRNNFIQYNNGYGVESYAARQTKVDLNTYIGNGNHTHQEKISSDKYLVME